MRIRRSRSLVCQQAVELVTEYLDDSLSRPDRRRFEAHLADCPHCAAYLAQIRSTIAALGRIEADDLPSDVQDGLVDLYRQWIAG